MKYVMLFGGGAVLEFFTNYLFDRNQKLTVITSNRLRNLDFEESYINKYSIDYLVLEKLENSIELKSKLKKNDCIGFSFGAPWIFKQEIISKFKSGLYNLHSFPLPLYRGAASLSWMIMRGLKQGCCLVHEIDSGIDTGNIVFTKEFRYPAEFKKPIEYEKYLIEMNKAFILDFYQKLVQGNNFNVQHSPDYLSSYYPRIFTPVHGFINWAWTIKEIYRFINAFDIPYPGARCFWNKKLIRLFDIEIEDDISSVHPFMIGLVFKKSNQKLYIYAKNGILIVGTVLTEEGENVIDMIRLGDRFNTPQKYIDDAMNTRVVFTANGPQIK